MNSTKRIYRLALIFMIFAFVAALYPQADAFAAPLNQSTSDTLTKQAHKTGCTFVKIIPQFRNEKVITRNGFHIDLFGTGELDFARDGRLKYATLRVAPDLSGAFNASRLTEVVSEDPPEERVKCWQPTAQWDVVVSYIVRFEKAVNPGLTENLVLWNAPIGEGGESLPFTVIGATRNQLFPGYMAMISQDLVMAPEPTGFMQFAPMPEWLDPTEWHVVQIRVSQQGASIAVAQALQDYRGLDYNQLNSEQLDSKQLNSKQLNYEVVLEVELPAPVEPLAFEFSLDNEVLPGLIIPVAEQDSLDVASLGIWYERNH